MAHIKCAHQKITKIHSEEELAIKGAHLLGPSFESKFDELNYEITHKIDKELSDSQNARDYIAQKYDELCNKIQFLTELDATVTGFRCDVKAIEKQIAELTARVDDIEKRTIINENPSLAESSYVGQIGQGALSISMIGGGFVQTI